MTRGAATTLSRLYEVGSTPVEVIPHGARVNSSLYVKRGSARPKILTWGLIGPGKGIEWVIDAMVGLKDLRPRPVYVVAGRTHPKVLAHQGDGYRRSLIQRVATHGLSESADVVVLPYDSKDQATSGVLVDAIAAGRPVVATEFPHANELLATGAGIIVAHKDAAALTRALRRVLSDSKVAADMAREARFLASGLSWRAVAVQFQATADRLLHYSEVHV